ncbi:unnamed protein product [Mytilus edulis]|uniref:Uncharacterized protein n=1 Tax=Mytilus edulis TaxID=6550 RepID=A0A8S3UHI9_MYTED|nr:unnamed protein product [Mytilus edulis]
MAETRTNSGQTIDCLKPIEQKDEDDSIKGIQIQCSTGSAYETFYGTDLEQVPPPNSDIPVQTSKKKKVYTCPSDIVIRVTKSSGKDAQREVQYRPTEPGSAFQTNATKKLNKTVQSKPKESNQTINTDKSPNKPEEGRNNMDNYLVSLIKTYDRHGTSAIDKDLKEKSSKPELNAQKTNVKHKKKKNTFKKTNMRYYRLKPLEQNGEEESTQGIQIQCSTGLAYDTFYGIEQRPDPSNTTIPAVWTNINNEIYSFPSNINVKPVKSSGKGKPRKIKSVPVIIPGITVPFQTKATKRANKTIKKSKTEESNRTTIKSRNDVDSKLTTKDKRGRRKSPTKTPRKSPDTGSRKIMVKQEVTKSFINEKKGRIASKVIQPGNQNPKLLDNASPKKMKSERKTPRGKLSYKFTHRKSLKKLSGKKYLVKDSNFWNMPLLAITSIESPDMLTTGDLSALFGCVPTGDSIDGDIISLALEDCLSNRGRFALALFHYIISIGELYNRNISGSGIKMKINPFKIKMIRALTFQHFPAATGEEEVEWKYIVNRMHVTIWHAEKFIQKWLIIKPPNHYSLE